MGLSGENYRKIIIFSVNWDEKKILTIAEIPSLPQIKSEEFQSTPLINVDCIFQQGRDPSNSLLRISAEISFGFAPPLPILSLPSRGLADVNN